MGSLFSSVRYLTQKGLHGQYTDAFGHVEDVPIRQDVQLQKFFLPFSGWFLTPKFRYYLYVWSSNPSQGDPAQVVGAGNISYVFNRSVTFGGGITSLPSVRTTEGQFPYWLGVDDRLIADEYFRGSYTSGLWLKGEFATKFKYMAMLGNNLEVQLSTAVERNVRWTMRQIAESPEGRARSKERRLTLVGGIYEVASGRVRFLPDEGR